jgi:hypothetical protein
MVLAMPPRYGRTGINIMIVPMLLLRTQRKRRVFLN